jgi:hypothetical protein
MTLRLPAADLRGLAHDGVLSRAELRDCGWGRDAVARQVAAQRWAMHGRQTVALHTAELGVEAQRWRAVFEVGSKIALLDGSTALQAAGLTGYADDNVHVSVPHTASVESPPGVRIHKVIRRVSGEPASTGIPRTVPAVAAVRAAHWAVSDRQAALVLVMPVQQHLITGGQLLDAVAAVRGRTRRRFVSVVARDIADGAQSLGELDFAGMCRGRGLPAPTRQSIRRLGSRRAYLDAAWDDIGLAVEIDGSQHQWGVAATDDHFRQNDLVLRGDRVLRMTLMGLRLAPDRFMDQVCEAHRRLSRPGSR